MRILLLATIGLFFIAPAKAALYIYTPSTITDRGDQQLNVSDLAFTLGISDNAAASGAFNYAYSNVSSGPLRQGDVSGFQSFVVPAFLISVQGSTAGAYQLDISLSFDASGQVSNGFIYYEDNRYNIIVNGDSGNFGGTFFSGSTKTVNDVTGSIISQASVPEPSTLGVLGLVLAVAVFARHTRRSGWAGTPDVNQ